MPPRRSTRASTRASVEPVVAAEPPTTTSKRKRAQPAQEGGLTEEKENVGKPSRTRKDSVRQTTGARSNGRVSSRSKATLQNVPESDEEDQDQAQDDDTPPIKRPRSSPDEDGDAERDEPVPPTNGQKPASRASRRTGASKKATVKHESDMEIDGANSSNEDKSAPKRRTANRKSVAPPSTAKRPTVARKSTRTTRGASKAPQAPVKSEEEQAASDHSEKEAEELLRPSPVESQPDHGPSQTSSKTISSGDLIPVDREGSSSEVKVDAPKRRPSAHHSTPDADDASDKVAIDEVNEAPLDIRPPTQPLSQATPAAAEPTGPVTRLVIHKMVLINFKSYAGRQDIGPFHKSFSSIVGPNGSGKSNTIDALLFVFGYRASKMRQAKLSELIHNSAQYPDLDECSVEVHFREILDLPGPDAFEVVPDSQLVVARHAFKNNSSKYTINRRQSNFTEVQTLLKGRGIDLDHKRFLILQGEVESIAQMKPKAATEHEDGLLEYLEDIIGTSKYKEPINEALQEMEILQESRSEKLNRLRIVEREKNALEDQKREAENYLRIQNEHVRAQSRLWQFYLWQCSVIEQELNKKMARISKELEAERDQNKDDVAYLEMLEKHYEERQKAYEDVRAAAADAVKDLASREKQGVGLEERRKHASTKSKKLKKSMQEDESAKKEASRSIDENSEKIEREKKKVRNLEAELEKEENVLEGIRDSLKDKTQVFHDQIEVKQKELQPWTAKVNAKQAEIDVASSERDALKRKADAVKDALKEAQENLDELRKGLDDKTEQLRKLQSDKTHHTAELEAARKRSEETSATVRELKEKAGAARQKADEAKSSQTAATSQNRVLDSLLRLRSSGRINGFHGRLGSLGTIPDKYDVAVSTACTTLNNLVVDTVEQGQSCIEYLRNQNVGRASFIVLDKLPQINTEKIATPENVPRLFDLIKPINPRFAGAFYKGVRDTLVADNLDQANRIAFGGQRRWRVVTLAGQLIDSSGTMSGGGNYVSKGGMSSKVAAEAIRPEDVRVLEQDSQRLAERLESALSKLREIDAALEELSRSAPQVDMQIQKIGLDIENEKKRINECEKRVRDLKSQSKPDAGAVARIAALDQEIAASTRELEELQAKSGKIEKAIQELEKKILEIGGSKLLTQKSKVEGIRLHINIANDEITKAEVAKAKAEKDTLKFNATIQSNQALLQDIDADLEALNDQITECAQYIQELQAKVDAAQAAAEHQRDDLETLKAELDAKMEEVQKFRKKEMDLQQNLTDLKKEAAENERGLDHWQTEHDKLKLEEVDDEEDEEAPEAAVEGEVKAEVKEEPGVAKPASRTPSNELHIYNVEELQRYSKRELIADTELLDEKLKNLKPNLVVLKEYRRREKEFFKRAKDLDQITAQRDGQKAKYEGLRKQRLDEFMTGFNLISLKLKEMYQMITLGGNAELELVDSMDPFAEGIIFSVMPPKKSWKNISNLSGGEKTLSSLALVFALHVFKPTPLYFMDEIDAALDFRNVSIVANYIKDRTKNAQFIIISLRNDMFELSHRLIGIYKTANATKSISIDNHPLR